MPTRRSWAASLALVLFAACAPPGDIQEDGLEAPPTTPTTPTTPPPPPPPPPPTSGLNPALPSTLFPNAPSGGAWVQVGSLTWADPIPFRGTYDPDNGTHLINWGDDDPARDWGRQTPIVADPDVPGPVKNALELRLPAGMSGGYASSKIGQHPDWRGNGPLLWDPSICTGHVYIGFYVRFSPGFSLNDNVGQKVLYLKSDVAANRAIAHMPGIMMADGNGGDQLWPEYQPQHPFANYGAVRSSANDLNDGLWHLVEMLQGPNTPGTNNGTLQLWVDGRLEGSWTNARFFDAGQVPSLNRLEISPIYGGGLNPVLADQWVRLGPIDVRVH